jgi:hypothetical protein
LGYDIDGEKRFKEVSTLTTRSPTMENFNERKSGLCATGLY